MSHLPVQRGAVFKQIDSWSENIETCPLAHLIDVNHCTYHRLSIRKATLHHPLLQIVSLQIETEASKWCILLLLQCLLVSKEQGAVLFAAPHVIRCMNDTRIMKRIEFACVLTDGYYCKWKQSPGQSPLLPCMIHG